MIDLGSRVKSYWKSKDYWPPKRFGNPMLWEFGDNSNLGGGW